MRNRTALLIVLAIIALPVVGLLSIFVSTHQRMTEFRTRITPGMSVAELLAFAGQPNKVLHRGEPLGRARRSYILPPLDENTAIYFYPKEGMPYYNVYVFINEQQRAVTRSDIENLWW